MNKEHTWEGKEDDQHFCKVPWKMTPSPIDYYNHSHLISAPSLRKNKYGDIVLFRIHPVEVYHHDWCWPDEDCLGKGINMSHVDSKAIIKLVEQAPVMYMLLKQKFASDPEAAKTIKEIEDNFTYSPYDDPTE